MKPKDIFIRENSGISQYIFLTLNSFYTKEEYVQNEYFNNFAILFYASNGYKSCKIKISMYSAIFA